MPNTLQAFLVWASTTSGAAGVTYLVIELVAKYWPAGLTGNQKFYAAFVLSVGVPVLAYLGSVGLGYVPFTGDGLWASILVTIFLAQSVHRQTSLAAAATPVLLTAASSLQVSGVDTPFAPLVPSVVTTAPPYSGSAAQVLRVPTSGNVTWAPPPAVPDLPPPSGVVLEEPTS